MDLKKLRYFIAEEELHLNRSRMENLCVQLNTFTTNPL